MSDVASISCPILEHEVSGLQLRYDGWRDKVSGSIRDEHSNRKEMRWYGFTVARKHGKAEIEKFSIAVPEHINPDHFRKGTASANRKDVKARILNRAEIWRRQKLKEQEILLEAMRSLNATKFGITPYLETWHPPFPVSYIPDVILFEPAEAGRNCRKGWIETISIGRVAPEVAQYIAQLYFDNEDHEGAAREANRGLSLAELKIRFDRSED